MRKLANNSDSYNTSVQAMPSYDRCDILCPMSDDYYYSQRYYYLKVVNN